MDRLGVDCDPRFTEQAQRRRDNALPIRFVELDHKMPQEIAELILERLNLIDRRREEEKTTSATTTNRPAKTSIPNNLPIHLRFNQAIEQKEGSCATSLFGGRDDRAPDAWRWDCGRFRVRASV
jgi:hypothetical protein